jgi:hypothetical protein
MEKIVFLKQLYFLQANIANTITAFLLSVCLIVNVVSLSNYATIETHFDNANKIELEAIVYNMVARSIKVAIKMASILDENINTKSKNLSSNNHKYENKDNRKYIKSRASNDTYTQILEVYVYLRISKYINFIVNEYLNINSKFKNKNTKVTRRVEGIRKNNIFKIIKKALPRGWDIASAVTVNNNFTWLYEPSFYLYTSKKI